MEERYPELAEKRVAFGLTQELQNVVSYIGRFNMIEADRDMQLAIRNDLKANKAKITTAKYSGYVTIYDFAVNLKEEIKAGKGDVQAEQQESSAHRYLMMPEPVEPAKYGFSGTIQQQPTPARVFTAAHLSKMKTTGNFGYILKRAVKRSSKSAVLKQLAAFARKNKKHANKCLLYKEYIRCI